jgi:hypothetical protein
MSFDPKQGFPWDAALPGEWAVYRMFARLIFETLITVVVREHYGFRNPAYVTLQADHSTAVLFVLEGGRTYLREDHQLSDWVWSFIAGEVLEVEPDQVHGVYLSGHVSTDDPFLHISGDDLLIASGQASVKGKHLS